MSPGRVLSLIAVAWIGLVLVASAQAVLPLEWPRHVPGPDVVLLVIVYLGLSGRGGLSGACALALFLGWLADLSAGAPKGLHMVAYALVGLAARGASLRLLVRGGLLTALVAGVFSLACGALVVALRTSLSPSLGWAALRQVPLAAAVTALAAPPLFRLLRRFDRRFVRDPRTLGGDGNGRSVGGLS